jgi:hypothetical protein
MMVAALCMLTFAVNGCKEPTKEAPKPPTGGTAADKDKKEIKITPITAETEVAKKGDTKVNIEIDIDAPADIALAAKGDKATGKGEIKKGAKKGELTITTTDADKLTELTVTATSSATKDAETKLKVKLK